MAPGNTGDYLRGAAQLIGMGMDYKNQQSNRPNRGAKRSGGGGGARKSARSGGGSTATIHSHGITGPMTVVQVVHNFRDILHESSPGVQKYTPGTIAVAAGKLSDYKPLAARAKVRFSFNSETTVHVSWDGARKLISTKRYTSPWMDLHIAMPIKLTTYGKDPVAGEYIVECAGLIDWDAEFQNRSSKTKNIIGPDSDEDESEDEVAPPRRVVASPPPKPSSPTANMATKRT